MIFSAPLSLGKTEHPASIQPVNFLISLNDRNNLLVLNNSLYCFPFAVTLSPPTVNDFFFSLSKNTLALPDFQQNVLPYSHTPSHDVMVSCPTSGSALLSSLSCSSRSLSQKLLISIFYSHTPFVCPMILKTAQAQEHFSISPLFPGLSHFVLLFSWWARQVSQ